ncbi:hypothetical protein H4219_004382 [Mycoemilia scoparia]|uniref:RING-type domain-containing protein n=1 Tax=Mycoemilia scoparia TaxID=417184 RepID=A0A9W7ZRV9_9FUNG|nr:hypothetical protein H4219_004382 [Mycoemilia scoparia]
MNLVIGSLVRLSGFRNAKWHAPAALILIDGIYQSLGLKISIMPEQELEAKSTRILREYLLAYNLFNTSQHLEKRDLIRTIQQNSPMPYVSEVHYRNNIPSPSSNSHTAQTDAPASGTPHEPESNSTRSHSGTPPHNSQGNSTDDPLRFVGNWNAVFNELGTGILQSVEQAGERFGGFINEILPDIDRYNSGPPPWGQYMDNEYRHNPTNRRSRSRSSQRTSGAQSSQTPSTDIPTLSYMVSNNTNPSSLSAKQLKKILDHYHVDYTNVLEKKELEARLQRLIDATRRDEIRKLTRAELESKSSDKGKNESHESTENGSDTCRICWENGSNCAFLNCGHMCTCHDCAERLKLDKNECPICREPIARIVRIFKS